MSAIIWFENIYMKLKQGKCHFVTCGSTEHLWVKVGNEMIWESKEEIRLGVTIDKELNFNSHLSKLCSKVSQKVSVLARIMPGYYISIKEGHYTENVYRITILTLYSGLNVLL